VFGAYKPYGLRYEHSVPIAVLADQLRAVTDKNEAMRRVIGDPYRPAWVAESEDQRLNRSGLNSQDRKSVV